MLILIEGADMTGKTTLGKTLAHSAELDYIHQGPPYSLPSVAHHLKIVGRMLESGNGVVMDRGHWSDHAYGSKYHPDNCLGDDGFDLLDRVYDSLGAVVVHAWLPAEDIAEMHTKMAEDYLELDDIHRVLTAMSDACFLSRLPVFHHNFKIDPADIDGVLAAAKARSVKL